MPGRVTVPKVVEEIIHPWGQGLEVNGIVYSSVLNTNASLTHIAGHTKSVNIYPHGYPGGIGTLKEVELGFTVEFFSPNNGDNIINWFLQGRNASGASPQAPFDASWVALCVNQEQTKPINAGYKSNTISGYPSIQTNFNKVPFEIRLSFQANTVNVNQSRIKNSSYVRYLYTID